MNTVNPERVSVELSPAPFGLIMSVSGDLDAGTVRSFLQQTADFLVRRGPVCVLVDLTDVSFCDSSGLSVLIRLWRHVIGDSGIFALTGAHGTTARILQTTAMHRVFPHYPSREKAIGALTRARPRPAQA